MSFFHRFYDIEFDIRSNRWWEVRSAEAAVEFPAHLSSRGQVGELCPSDIPGQFRPWMIVPWSLLPTILAVVILLKCLAFGDVSGGPKRRGARTTRTRTEGPRSGGRKRE